MDFDYGNWKAKGYRGYFLSHCSGYSRRNVHVAAGFAHQSRSFFHDPRLYFIFLLYGAQYRNCSQNNSVTMLSDTTKIGKYDPSSYKSILGR